MQECLCERHIQMGSPSSWAGRLAALAHRGRVAVRLRRRVLLLLMSASAFVLYRMRTLQQRQRLVTKALCIHNPLDDPIRGDFATAGQTWPPSTNKSFPTMYSHRRLPHILHPLGFSTPRQISANLFNLGKLRRLLVEFGRSDRQEQPPPT